MACCVDRCTNPLSLVTRLPNFDSDTLIGPVNISAATPATATLINTLSLTRSYPDSDVLVEGVVEINFSGLAAAVALTGSISVQLDVYRTSAIAGVPIYSIQKSIFTSPVAGVLLVAVPTTNEIPFQFTDSTALGLPDGANPAEYYVRVSVVAGGALVLGATTVNVVRSDAAASEEVVL
ncbi:hypothetical protein [Clostridium paridis]|uniref:Uncharacterized protein n=1 Tax=Clostridium paridis TaxID=2803863 RepID=A0A937FIG2_9CLOT|nr:hypothetical protein [Clostridium paridis]MBL4933685.1 hypothetical protein [Clostridium paridis]